MAFDKKYDPERVEEELRIFWEKEKIYSFDRDSDKPVYSIDTPPPTVSGKMHMGHAFGNSQQDFIARYKRMKGFNVLQPLGTDDNGLPTQMLIEKTKKVRAHQMDRKEFRKLCYDTLNNELKPKYISDWKKLGISCDYEITYSTVDKHCQRISQKSFLELYEMGRAYRKEAPAMWCPKCGTAISQVECEDKEVETFFNDIIFKTKDQDLTIATTRPELLPACVAVFYHPEDKRYQGLKGKMAKVPLFDFEVPLLEDERADPEKGTGLVMCCTFGDQTDMEWQKAHNLPIKTAITKYGKMTSLAGEFEGLKVEAARKEIIEKLKEKELLTNQKKIKHAVNTHERCGTHIEYMHSKQWFIKYLDLKDDMLKWGEEFDWHPSHMKNRYDNWVKGLAWDWCISRQINFGIPFPVWYCDDCSEVIFAKEKDLPVDPADDKPPVDCCPKCQSKNLTGEKDIINTWATSSLTPTIVKELLKDSKSYDYLTKNPMDLRPQGHDIISFWLFNTVVKSKLHYNMKPWKNAFINGWMLDSKGKKMSKSKGNIVEPQGMIEKYSSDALRFMAASSKLGEDLPFPEKELVAGQKFIVKLFNASKFCNMHLESYKGSKPKKINLVDQWILASFSETVKKATFAFEEFSFSEARRVADRFFWQYFCDNYLEMIKARIYGENEEEKLSAQYTLNKILLGILKLYSPFTPFITEHIYQELFAKKEKEKSVHISSWPKEEDEIKNLSEMTELITSLLSSMRKYKTENSMSLKDELSLVKAKAPLKLEDYTDEEITQLIEDLKTTSGAKELILEEGEEQEFGYEK
jgi:valyl-tRNA synthetase